MKTTIDTLNELPGLVADVLISAGQGAPNPGGQTSRTKKGKPDSKAPTDLIVLDALARADHKRMFAPRPRPGATSAEIAGDYACQLEGDRLLSRLVECIDMVIVRSDFTTPDPGDQPTWVEACSWLRETATIWQAEDELADDVTSTIENIRRDLARLDRQRPPYRPRCRYCRDRVILVDGSGQEASPEDFSHGYCLGCQQTYPKGPALDALGSLQDLPAHQLADLLEVPADRVRQWVKRGKLTAEGRDSRGRAVYSISKARILKAGDAA